MLLPNKIIRIASIVALLVLFSGCLPGQSQEPTANLDLVRTESALTVVANITVDAALNPSATPTFPPAPTSTPIPPPSATVAESSATISNTQTTPDNPSAAATKAPTATWKVVQSQPALDCKLINQIPKDGYKIEAGGFFDVTWTVENTGTTAWQDTYVYQYWKGRQYAKFPMYQLGREVRPDTTINLVADMIAPNELGQYETWWRLVDNNGKAFCSFYFSVIVDAPTETPTPTQP